MPARIAVAGWIGAGNLGDELLLRATLRELDHVGLAPLVLSRDPEETARVHRGVQTVGHLSAHRWLPACDGLVFGGGGLVQDRTSRWSPLYQASRPLLAAAGHKPVIAVGLGAEPLRSRSSKALFRRALAGALAVQARDQQSTRILQELGLVVDPTAADLTWLLPAPRLDVRDRLIVNLPPVAVHGGWVPASRRDVSASRQSIGTSAWAVALDELVRGTGLALHLVAMDRDRDHAIHMAVAERMTERVQCHRPSIDDVQQLFATATAVVAGRFHGCLLAAAAGRPTVALGYAPKVHALAADLTGMLEVCPYAGDVPDGLVAAVHRAVGATGSDPAATDAIRERALVARNAFERLAVSVRQGR